MTTQAASIDTARGERLVAAEARVVELEAGIAERDDYLRGLEWMFDQNVFCRDTSRDHEHDYMMRSLRFGIWLAGLFKPILRDPEEGP